MNNINPDLFTDVQKCVGKFQLACFFFYIIFSCLETFCSTGEKKKLTDCDCCRHRKYSLRLCGSERHHPAAESEGVQPGVRWRRPPWQQQHTSPPQFIVNFVTSVLDPHVHAFTLDWCLPGPPPSPPCVGGPSVVTASCHMALGCASEPVAFSVFSSPGC